MILQYIFMGGAIFCGLFFLTLESHGLRLSDSREAYADSTSFANTFYDATTDVARALASVLPYTGDNTVTQTDSGKTADDTTTDSSVDDTHVIDLNEVLNNSEISFTNTSGLAYSFADLEKWASKKDYFKTSSENPIVICHVADNSDEEEGV